MSDYDPNFKVKKNFAIVGQKAVVIGEKNKILLLQRSEKSGAGGKWSLPGGALEDNEDPFSGIEREIKEETELNVVQITPFQVRSYRNKSDEFVVIIGYQCIAKSTNVKLNWEHTHFEWLFQEEAVEKNLTDDARFFLESFNKMAKNQSGHIV